MKTFKRTQIAKQLFNLNDSLKIRVINIVVEVLKRKGIGSKSDGQSISYSESELDKLKKISSFLLFLTSNECPNFVKTDEKIKLIENITLALKESRPLFIFALFCPSYKKGKGVAGFNSDIGETTKTGINNLDILSKKATQLEIPNETNAIYSDLVLENFSKLKKKDFEDMEKNFSKFKEYIISLNPNIKIKRISQIGDCQRLIGKKGVNKGKINVSEKAIKRIVDRSLPFYKYILGWEKKQIEKRTEVLARSCSIMGQEIKKINPYLFMLMTENIYERGIFYNANNLDDPIPIFYPRKKDAKIARISLL